MPTLPDLPTIPRRLRAAGLLLLAFVLAGLGGCGMLRMTYASGPELAYWWFDRYADFDDTQSARARVALADAFAWHRREQLPAIADQLARLQHEAMQATDAEAVCRWQDATRERVDAVLLHVLPQAVSLAATLTPQQIARIEQRQMKMNAEFRDEHLQRDPVRRREQAFERALDRLESMYGRLDAAQRDRLARALEASPYDPERWLAERRARQQRVLQTLRGLQSRQLDAAGARGALALLATGADAPALDAEALRRVSAYNCRLIADIHNHTTPAQRQTLRDKLRGWELDLRALARDAQTAQGARAAEVR